MSDTPSPQAPQSPTPRRRAHVQFGPTSRGPSPTPSQSVNVTLASPKGGKRARHRHVQFGLPPAQTDPNAPPPQTVQVTVASKAA